MPIIQEFVCGWTWTGLHLHSSTFILYLVILALSPLLFGSVHTYAYTIMSLGVLTGSLLLIRGCIKKEIRTGLHHFHLPVTCLNLPFIVLLIYLSFQIIPLPESLLAYLSPEAAAVGQKTLPASGSALVENPARQWFAVSPYYYPVRMSIVRWSVYVFFFIGLSQVLTSQKRIEKTIFLILILGSFEALYGLIQTYSGSRHIWWFKSITDPRAATGTYINRNHFAGFMEMGVLLAAAYAAALSGKKKKTKIRLKHKSSLRVRLSRYLSAEQRFNKRTFIVFSGVIMALGLVFSASRGGIVSAAGAMLLMGLVFLLRRRHRLNGIIILVLFLMTSAYALHIGVDYPVGRFKYFDISFEARTRLAKTTLDMFDDYRLGGVGVGNFQYAYPKYQDPQDKKSFVRHAHNDWAQFLAEAGIVGFCLLLVAISYYLYRTIRLLHKRSDPFAVSLGIAPLAALTTMAIHSYSDFNLHIPANGLMLAAVMAIGNSALHLDRHRGRDKTFYRCHVLPIRHKGAIALLAVLGFVACIGSWTIRHFVAEAHCNTVRNSTLNRDQKPPLEEIRKAVEWDRYNAEYWYRLAGELKEIRNAERANPDFDNEDAHRHQMEIIRALEEAVRLNPFKAEYHLQLGWEYTYMWREPDSYQKWFPAADLSVARAAYFAGDVNPYLHVMMGNYWLMRSKTIHPADPQWETFWSKARWHYKKNLALESGGDRRRMMKQIRKNVWVHYPDEAFVRRAIE